MGDVAADVENDVIDSVAEGFGATEVESSAESDESQTGIGARYEFDETFQTKIAAMAIRDARFNQQTEGLIQAEFFENQAEATLVSLGMEYFAKYKRCPDTTVLTKLVKDAVASKRIRKDMIPEVRDAIKGILKADIGDREYVIDEVSSFARHQAMGSAILDSVELIEKRDFDRAFDKIKRAMEVGSIDGFESYDFFEQVSVRTAVRKELAAGIRKRDGITTGNPTLDKYLHHHGWGRREMAVIMGGPKAGKSTALGDFAKSASLAGYNALYVTLEVSKEIIAERMDANIADIPIGSLESRIIDVEDKITKMKARAGKLILHEFPTGTMTPAMLRRLIAKYKAQGVVFDAVFVDYADIMAPDYRTSDPIENSKQIYVGLRAIAQEENFALVTATQTNREGAKAAVAKAEHVAEDFNRIRIADLVISINKTDEEKAKGEARLFMAASRNQKGDITFRIKQDLERMRFITKVLAIEE